MQKYITNPTPSRIAAGWEAMWDAREEEAEREMALDDARDEHFTEQWLPSLTWEISQTCTLPNDIDSAIVNVYDNQKHGDALNALIFLLAFDQEGPSDEIRAKMRELIEPHLREVHEKVFLDSLIPDFDD